MCIQIKLDLIWCCIRQKNKRNQSIQQQQSSATFVSSKDNLCCFFLQHTTTTDTESSKSLQHTDTHNSVSARLESTYQHICTQMAANVYFSLYIKLHANIIKPDAEQTWQWGIGSVSDVLRWSFSHCYIALCGPLVNRACRLFHCSATEKEKKKCTQWLWKSVFSAEL